MEFVLHYEGPLPSAQGQEGSSARAEARQKIRRAVHAQLADLWTLDSLDHLRPRWGAPSRLDPHEAKPETRVDVDRVGRKFVPLVCRGIQLLAHITFTIYARGVGTGVAHESDIDNRLKFLIDALRLPDEQMGWEFVKAPLEVKGPIFTLLEDDLLLVGYTVAKERWLGSPSDDVVRITMRVRLSANSGNFDNLELVL